jgi:hypothetical protein
MKKGIRISFGRAFAFSSIAVLAALASLEVLLRLTHLFGAAVSWSQPDPLLGYRYVPHKRYWFFKENDHPITGRINRYGFRDKDWSMEKPEDTYRIAVLGDSFVEAFAVESDRTFLALLERRLNENPCRPGIRAEVMNFGRSGYTQTEELLVLTHDVLPFSPDVVMLVFYPGNDIEDVSKETSPEPDRPFFHLSSTGALVLDTSFTEAGRYKIRSLVNRVKQHSALVSLIGDRVNLYVRMKRFEQRDQADRMHAGTGISGSRSLCTARPSSTYASSYALNKILIKAMADACRQRGVDFMLVVLCEETYVPRIERQLKDMDPTFDPYFFEKDLEKYASEIGASFIGLQKAFREGYEESGALLHWSHLNYLGHSVAAKALAPRVRSLLCRGYDKGESAK